MIVALEEAKRKLSELESVVEELGNQLRIEEAKERAAELERETLVQDFWNDAEKSSKKLQEIKQLQTKVQSYEELVAKLEDTYTLCEMAIDANEAEEILSSYGYEVDTVTAPHAFIPEGKVIYTIPSAGDASSNKIMIFKSSGYSD